MLFMISQVLRYLAVFGEQLAQVSISGRVRRHTHDEPLRQIGIIASDHDLITFEPDVRGDLD
jgi:hypothetical protein